MARTRLAITAALAAAALLGSADDADAARARKLKTTKGSMQLGGAVSVAVDTFAPERRDNTTGVVFSISPSYGYFVADGLELNIPLIIDLRIGDLYEKAPHSIAITPGLRYVFGTGTIVLPFVGVNLGPKFMIPERGDTTTALSWRTPAGILIALNHHVGLTVGMALDVTFGFGGSGALYPYSVAGQDTVLVEFLVGYLGVEAFF
jgi:hypothetical protein